MNFDQKELDHEEAKAAFYKFCCPDVAEPLVMVKRREQICLGCGWVGIPKRTTNSGGVTNYKYCPACKYEWFKEKE